MFRKAVYQEYTDQSFSTRKPVTSQQGLLGPVLRASVGETLKIHVRNNAKRPFSFYTDGLKTQKNITGTDIPEGGGGCGGVRVVWCGSRY